MKICAVGSLNKVALSSLLILFISPLLLLVTACGSSHVISGPPAVMPTVTVAASPSSITAGNSSTLTVAATNATSITLTGSDGSTFSVQPSGGTQAVKPAATTTYTASANGTGGTATATAIVTVTAPATPPTVTIAASPSSITAGSSSTLTVAATNATTVTVTGSDGSTYNLAVTGGTQSVTPSATTTYTANVTGTGGTATATATVTVTAPVPTPPTVTIAATPSSITAGSSSTLTVAATNATTVTVTGSDGSSYSLAATGGTQSVKPSLTTTYTASATGAGGSATATAILTVTAGNAQSINHVVFMLQENHAFDNYFGMLNPYRASNNWQTGDDGKTYLIDGIDDKLTTISNQNDEGVVFPLFKLKSSCVDDESSGWLESYGDVSSYDFTPTRPIRMDGFVHDAEGFARSCNASGTCVGQYTDTAGKRAMGYYDQDFLNYYYYMASQFALSDRWFSPVSSKSAPNRIATFTGGTTQGLVFDPGSDDHIGALTIPSIFEELDNAAVSWKVYYTVTVGSCVAGTPCGTGALNFPSTTLGYLTWSLKYLYENPTHAACTGTTQPSSVVGDTSNDFCIDPNHIAPLSTYYTDLTNSTLPSFSFIESGDISDEHPASGESVLYGQEAVAKIVNSFMASPSWKDSAFFFGYDEGGGPYDHVPPVPNHTNDFTSPSLGTIPDIASISVNADSYQPCVPAGGTATVHCDVMPNTPGAKPADAAAISGFAAQLGFRVPNIVISPFARRHYVSHVPMDHTAVIRFVESRFIGSSAHLTARDAAQPNLMDFFDFTNVPWANPPTPPAPVTATTLGYDPCTPTSLGP
jgi:phospholipase C